MPLTPEQVVGEYKRLGIFGPKGSVRVDLQVVPSRKRARRISGVLYVPRVIITDKLKSYAAGKRKTLPGVEHRQNRYGNNRAEVSRQPTRRRERQMQRFKSARHAQRLLYSHSRIHNHFQLRRHRLSAGEHRQARDAAFQSWRDVARIPATV